MEKKDDQIMYLVPANVSARFELIPGFGWKELITVVSVVFIAFIISMLLGIPQKTVYKDASSLIVTDEMIVNESGQVEVKESIIPLPGRAIFVLMIGVFTFFLVKKEPSVNMSPVDSIKRSINFSKRQQQYKYKYNSGNRR